MVALLTNNIKVSFIGTRTGGEEWSTGFWVTCAGAPTQVQLDAFTLDMDTAWRTFFNTSPGPNLAMSSDTHFTKTHTAFYAAGSSTAGVSSEHVGAQISGAGTTPHPYQVGLVASLRTPIPGRRTRGRMYLPFDSLTAAGAGQTSLGLANLTGAAIVALIHSVNSATYAFGPQQVVVASHASGQVNPVTVVVVDTVPDIQRRRANRLTPVGTSVNPV